MLAPSVEHLSRSVMNVSAARFVSAARSISSIPADLPGAGDGCPIRSHRSTTMKNKPTPVSAPAKHAQKNEALRKEIRRLRRDRRALQISVDGLKAKCESLDAESERQRAFATDATRQREVFRRWLGRYEKIFWTGFAFGAPPAALVLLAAPMSTPQWWITAEHALMLVIGAGYFGLPRLRRIWHVGDPAADLDRGEAGP
jgi:hypothetical protein